MRKLENVIDAMVRHIPASETVLLEQLESVRESVLYASPETVRMWWLQTAEILTNRLGENKVPEDSWEKAVERVWMNE